MKNFKSTHENEIGVGIQEAQGYNILSIRYSVSPMTRLFWITLGICFQFTLFGPFFLFNPFSIYPFQNFTFDAKFYFSCLLLIQNTVFLCLVAEKQREGKNDFDASQYSVLLVPNVKKKDKEIISFLVRYAQFLKFLLDFAL